MTGETDVIIIRGAPGSGKSQTARSLSAHFPKGVRLEVDTLRSMVISVNWTDQSEHINILSVAASLVKDFVKLGYSPIILVDTFSGDKLTNFLAALQKPDTGINVRSFALVTTPEVLKARIDARPANEFKEVGISQKLNSDTFKHLHSFEQLIDTSELTPDQTAGLIMEGLARKKNT